MPFACLWQVSEQAAGSVLGAMIPAESLLLRTRRSDQLCFPWAAAPPAAERSARSSKGWLSAAPDPEVRRPKDFFTRRLAGRPVIFLRDREGTVRCLLNICPHRGAQVCRQRSGSAKLFSCIYHGWAFENTGKVISIAAADTYHAQFNAPGCNAGSHVMVPVPRFQP